jgi:hypothetical protein
MLIDNIHNLDYKEIEERIRLLKISIRNNAKIITIATLVVSVFMLCDIAFVDNIESFNLQNMSWFQFIIAMTLVVDIVLISIQTAEYSKLVYFNYLSAKLTQLPPT